MAIEWTNGWKVINFEINDNQYHGFIKVTKKGEKKTIANKKKLTH